MDKLKATLSRKIGPFSVGVWLIVVIVGVGIGLLVRKRFTGGAGKEDASGQATVGYSDQDDYPYGIIDGVIVTGRAPDTVYIPGTGVTPSEPEIGRPTMPEIGTGTDVPKPTPLPAPPKTTTPPKTGAPTGTTYTVQKGDTLWKIAGKFGFPHWRPIYDANAKTIGPNPDLIKPGQKLVIPAK